MLIKTKGIVFKSIKYSETSLILDIYTEDKGLQQYIISGVRNKNAKTKVGILQPTSLVEMVSYYKEKKSINRIKEIKSLYTYQNIPFSVIKGTLGLFMVELAQKTIKEEVANPVLFQFLYTQFVQLDQIDDLSPNFHLYFMLQLTEYLGFAPSNNWSLTTPFFDMKEGLFISKSPPQHLYTIDKSTSQYINKLIAKQTINITRKERQKILNHLIVYYKLHAENFTGLNTPAILKEVL